MDEYNLEVIIDGHKETIKTYANSIEHAIDAMVVLDNVESIYIAIRTKDNKTWKFDKGELDYLREMRGLIDSEAAIKNSLKEKGLHDE